MTISLVYRCARCQHWCRCHGRRTSLLHQAAACAFAFVPQVRLPILHVLTEFKCVNGLSTDEGLLAGCLDRTHMHACRLGRCICQHGCIHVLYVHVHRIPLPSDDQLWVVFSRTVPAGWSLPVVGCVHMATTLAVYRHLDHLAVAKLLGPNNDTGQCAWRCARLDRRK